MKIQRLARKHPAASLAAAAAVPLAVGAVLAVFRDDLTQATDVLVLVAVVVVFSSTGLRAAALTAAISAVVWFDYFLTEPYHTLAITGSDDLEAAALLLVIGGLVTETALWGQRADAELTREVGYIDGVLATAESMSADPSTREEQALLVSMRIREVLDLDGCTFEAGGTASADLPTLNHDGSVTRGGRNVDVDRDGLPVDSVVVLPVRAGGELRGRFLLTAASHVSRPTERQRRVAVLLADQIAGTLTGTVP